MDNSKIHDLVSRHYRRLLAADSAFHLSKVGRHPPVAIIGTGPAGIACAIQLKRYGIEPILFEKNEIGGLLRNANLVENYPGYPDGVSGMDLVKKFNEHLEHLNLQPIFQEVEEIEYNKEIFELKTNAGSFKSRILVIASGTIAKKPDIKTDKNIDNKVFYEIQDLYKQQTQDKKVVIIGSGDAAFDYAINLASNSNVREVVILNRSSGAKCLNLLKQRAFEKEKIKYIENETPIKLQAISNRSVLICRSAMEIETDYVLIAIGRKPNLNFLKVSEQKNNNKIFFIGDVKNDIFRQSSIAAGDGIKAAMRIYGQLMPNCNL